MPAFACAGRTDIFRPARHTAGGHPHPPRASFTLRQILGFNLISLRENWWAHKDSNLGPAD